MKAENVNATMTFEVTIDLAGVKIEDASGAHIQDVELDNVTVNGEFFHGWIAALKKMTEETQKGDWE